MSFWRCAQQKSCCQTAKRKTRHHGNSMTVLDSTRVNSKSSRAAFRSNTTISFLRFGRRLISLGLHDVTLSFVGVNGHEERQSLSNLMSRYGEGWQAEWLRNRAKVLKKSPAHGVGGLLRTDLSKVRSKCPMRNRLKSYLLAPAVLLFVAFPAKSQFGFSTVFCTNCASEPTAASIRIMHNLEYAKQLLHYGDSITTSGGRS